jgi:hypothetical protein
MGDIYTDIVKAIEAERVYQDKRWGGPEHDDAHDPLAWIMFTREYATASSERAAKYRLGVRLVKCAALAVAAIQSAQRSFGDSESVADIVEMATSTMTIGDDITPKSQESTLILTLVRHLPTGTESPKGWQEAWLVVIAYCVRVLHMLAETKTWPASAEKSTS